MHKYRQMHKLLLHIAIFVMKQTAFWHVYADFKFASKIGIFFEFSAFSSAPPISDLNYPPPIIFEINKSVWDLWEANLLWFL